MIILTLKTNPAQEHRQDFIDAFLSILNKVRQQKGCLEYDFYVDAEDPANVFLFERWQSKKEQEVHMKAPFMQAFVEKIQPWFGDQTEMHSYEINSRQPHQSYHSE